MRVAVYARYSSDLQRETSIDDQVAVARAYAQKQSWTVLDDHIYSDAGISGAALAGRPGVQALLQAASRSPRPFDVLLIDDTSRLARDTADAIRAVQELTFCGVRIIFISQGLDTASEQAETMVAVHGVVDQLYIRELKHKITRGLRGQLERGFNTGARTYGYRSVKVYDQTGKRDADGPVVIGKRLEIEPEQAAVIRQIFQWYLDGVSHPQMADRLNAMGAPTPRGSRWTNHHTQRMLKNERYLGRQIWGQTTLERRPGTNQRVARTRPRKDWLTRDRPDLQIVSPALFERAAERRRAIATTLKVAAHSGLARGRSGAYSKYLLTGLSRCATCGKGFTIVGGGCGSPRYGCTNSWRNGRGACDNRLTIMAKVADPTLVERLQAALLRPAMVRHITAAVTREVSRALTTQPAARKALETTRRTTVAKLDRLVAAIESGTSLTSITEQIAKRETELRQIENDLAKLEQTSDVDITVIPTWVQQQLLDLAGLLSDNPQRTKAELQRLGVGFTVTPVRDEGRPFLRVTGTGDLEALCATRDLPSTARRDTTKIKPPVRTAGALSLLR